MREKLNNEMLENARNAAIQAVLCGQEDTVRMIPKVETLSQQEQKRLCKRLAADEQWQLYDDLVYSKDGISFQGIASWGGRVCIRLNGYDHRFRILHLDRFKKRQTYLLPVGKAVKALPGIDLSEGELPLLIEMANAISTPSADKEHLFVFKNPLRSGSQARICESQRLAWDSGEFLPLLESHLELLPILTAALDSQLRALKRLRKAPVGLYNFLCPPKDSAAQDWLLSIFRAVTFTTENSEHPGPIIVQDLDTWTKCYRRLTVINATSRELIRPILDRLQERDQRRKCGDCLPPFSPTLPIAVSRSAVCSPFCVDVQLPGGLAPLTDRQQDLLRQAMGKVLSAKTADRACREWNDRMSSPSAYRLSGFEVWREVLVEQMVSVWFGSEELAERATNLCVQEKQQQADEAQARSAAIRSAFEYLADPARYENRITNCPKSKAEAKDLLSDQFFALCFTPKKGGYKDEKLLAFNDDSLRRLLRSIGVTDELYDAVLDFCEKEGFLVKRDHPITLGGETFHSITFRSQI